MQPFTQLNLEGKPGRGTARADHHSSFSGKQKLAAFVASVTVSSLLGIFLLTSGCSKSTGKPVVVATSTQTSSTAQPTPLPNPPSATTPATSQPKAVKSSRQRRVSTYTNPDYGISFRYPRHYSLKKGDQAILEWAGLGPVEMNFVQPGGTTLTAVELPRSSYPGTDFTSAFFNVSVNPKLTSAQCEQFAFPEASDPESTPGDEPDAASGVTSSKVKLGTTEFNEVEGSAGDATKQADAKYYHVFQNGTCYEFALGLQTAADDTADGAKPVDRDQVFRKLNWILSTVKIKSAAVPEKAVPEVTASAPSAPADGNHR